MLSGHEKVMEPSRACEVCTEEVVRVGGEPSTSWSINPVNNASVAAQPETLLLLTYEPEGRASLRKRKAEVARTRGTLRSPSAVCVTSPRGPCRPPLHRETSAMCAARKTLQAARWQLLAFFCLNALARGQGRNGHVYLVPGRGCGFSVAV